MCIFALQSYPGMLHAVSRIMLTTQQACLHNLMHGVLLPTVPQLSLCSVLTTSSVCTAFFSSCRSIIKADNTLMEHSVFTTAIICWAYRLAPGPLDPSHAPLPWTRPSTSHSKAQRATPLRCLRLVTSHVCRRSAASTRVMTRRTASVSWGWMHGSCKQGNTWAHFSGQTYTHAIA